MQIVITGISSSGGLTLEENGNPNNGHSSAGRSEEVHWRVGPDCGVKYIHAITIKTIAGSTNVFSSNPPRPQDRQNKHWKGTVNRDAEDYAVYVYSIEWVKDDGSIDIEVFDPIISIKPSGFSIIKLVAVVVAAVLGLFTLKTFIDKRSER